jgi:hypothetical protein
MALWSDIRVRLRWLRKMPSVSQARTAQVMMRTAIRVRKEKLSSC